MDTNNSDRSLQCSGFRPCNTAGRKTLFIVRAFATIALLAAVAEARPPRRGFPFQFSRSGPGTPRQRDRDDDPNDWRVEILRPQAEELPELEQDEAAPWPRASNDPYQGWRPGMPWEPTHERHQEEPLFPVMAIPELFQGYRVTRPHWWHFLPGHREGRLPNLSPLQVYNPELAGVLMAGDERPFGRQETPRFRNAATQTDRWTDVPWWMCEKLYVRHMHNHHCNPIVYCHRPHLYEPDSERELAIGSVRWEDRPEHAPEGAAAAAPDLPPHPEGVEVHERLGGVGEGQEPDDAYPEILDPEDAGSEASFAREEPDYYDSEASFESSIHSNDDVGIYSDIGRGQARESQTPCKFTPWHPIRLQTYHHPPNHMERPIGRMHVFQNKVAYIIPAHACSRRDRSHFNAGFILLAEFEPLWREFSELCPDAFVSIASEGVPGVHEPNNDEPETHVTEGHGQGAVEREDEGL